MAKLVKCKTCGAEIAKSAKFCPHCGAKHNRHIALQAVGCAIVVIWFFFVIASIGSGDSETSATEDNAVQRASSTIEQQPIDTDSVIESESETVDIIEISAVELWEKYDENEVNADNLYRDKTLRVNGVVSEIGKDIVTDTPYILLNVGDELGIKSVQCFFNGSDMQEKLGDIRDEDNIAISGICTGKTIYVVVLKNCSLEE